MEVLFKKKINKYLALPHLIISGNADFMCLKIDFRETSDGLIVDEH